MNEVLESALKELRAQRENSDSEVKMLKEQGKDLGLFSNPKVIANAENATDIQLIGQNILTANAKDISDQLVDLIKTATTGTLEEKKDAEKQVKFLEKISTTVADPEDRRLLEQQFDLMNQSLATNTNFLDGILKHSANLAPLLGGVMAGAFAENPALGALVAGVGKFGKDQISGFIERRKAEKETKENLILEKKQILENEAVENLQLEKDTVRDDVLKETSDDQKETVNLLKEGNEPDPFAVENAKEAEANTERRHNELLAASGSSDDTAPDASGIFGGLKKKFMAFKESIAIFGTSIAAFGAKWGPKLFKGLKVVLKKIPIIGPLIFGGINIFNNLSELPDDATIGEKIFAALRGAVDGILDFFLGIPIWIVDTLFGTDIGGFLESNGGISNTIGTALGEGVAKVVLWFKEMWNSVTNWIKDAIDNLMPDFMKSDTPEEKLAQDIRDAEEEVANSEASVAKRKEGGLGSSFRDTPEDLREKQDALDALYAKRDGVALDETPSKAAQLVAEQDNEENIRAQQTKYLNSLSKEQAETISTGEDEADGSEGFTFKDEEVRAKDKAFTAEIFKSQIKQRKLEESERNLKLKAAALRDSPTASSDSPTASKATTKSIIPSQREQLKAAGRTNGKFIGGILQEEGFTQDPNLSVSEKISAAQNAKQEYISNAEKAASSPSSDREKARVAYSAEAPESKSSNSNVNVVNAPSTTNVNNVAESKVFIKPTTQNSQKPLREDFAFSY